MARSTGVGEPPRYTVATAFPGEEVTEAERQACWGLEVLAEASLRTECDPDFSHVFDRVSVHGVELAADGTPMQDGVASVPVGVPLIEATVPHPGVPDDSVKYRVALTADGVLWLAVSHGGVAEPSFVECETSFSPAG